MNKGERVYVALSASSLAVGLILIALFQGLLPWQDQPLRLVTSSELSGEMSILLPNTRDLHMLETTVINQNGASIVVQVGRGSMTVEAHRQAFKDEVEFWIADTTIPGPPPPPE